MERIDPPGLSRRGFLAGFSSAVLLAPTRCLAEEEAPPPADKKPDLRPLAWAYWNSAEPNDDCRRIERLREKLPVRIVWRPAPAWVTVFPTLHWPSSKGRWAKTVGWQGLAAFEDEFAKLHVADPQAKPKPLSPFYEYTLNYGGTIWSHPGDIYGHLHDDLSHHGFGNGELLALSRGQLERLHSAHHEGRIHPGKTAPSVIPGV